jgi:antitoxin VapB
VQTKRHVRLFRNGRHQILTIPFGFELSGDEAIIRKERERLIIEPLKKCGLLALLETLQPLYEDFPEIEDPPVISDDISL